MRFPSWLVWTETGRASSVLTAQLSVLWISWAFCVQNSKVRNICKVYGISSRENLWRRSDASSPLCHGHMFHAWGRRDCTVSWLRRWRGRRRNERQGSVMRPNAGTFVEASRSRLNDLKCFFDYFCIVLLRDGQQVDSCLCRGRLLTFASLGLAIVWSRAVRVTQVMIVVFLFGKRYTPKSLTCNLTIEIYNRSRGDFFWT